MSPTVPREGSRAIGMPTEICTRLPWFIGGASPICSTGVTSESSSRDGAPVHLQSPILLLHLEFKAPVAEDGAQILIHVTSMQPICCKAQDSRIPDTTGSRSSENELVFPCPLNQKKSD